MICSVNDFDGRIFPAHERPGGLDEPLCCVVTGGTHHALLSSEAVQGFLANFYGGGGQVSSLGEPQRTVTTKDRSALVRLAETESLIDSEPPRLEECTFRMLKAHEIQRAMAFPGEYVVLGNQREQVKQLGNAVTPPAARDLLARCIETLA